MLTRDSTRDSDSSIHYSTFCPGVGAMKILRSLTVPEGAAAAESPPATAAPPCPCPPDDGDGKSSSEIRMARYFARCSTRAVVVVFMNLKWNGKVKMGDSTIKFSVRFWSNLLRIISNHPNNLTGFETHCSRLTSFLSLVKCGSNWDCSGISFEPHLYFKIAVKPK